MAKLVANGAAIRALRQTSGWRTTTFANHIGISHGYLSNIEAGRRQAPAPLLRRIAEALRVPLTAITNTSQAARTP